MALRPLFRFAAGSGSLPVTCVLSSFTTEFIKWTLPSLNLDKSTVENRGVCQNPRTGRQSKFKNRKANSVDPDKMACYEPSHLDLPGLHRHLCCL